MIEYNNLKPDEYMFILNTLGWKTPSERLLKKSLDNGCNCDSKIPRQRLWQVVNKFSFRIYKTKS